MPWYAKKEELRPKPEDDGRGEADRTQRRTQRKRRGFGAVPTETLRSDDASVRRGAEFGDERGGRQQPNNRRQKEGEYFAHRETDRLNGRRAYHKEDLGTRRRKVSMNGQFTGGILAWLRGIAAVSKKGREETQK